MYFVENYKEWVTPELINYLESLTTGAVKIKDVRVSNKLKEDDAVLRSWSQWFHNSSEMKGNVIAPKFPVERKNIFWWMVRLRPGEFQPIHIDPHLLKATNPKRYTLFLQDFDPGHIYIYNENKITVNYRAGDLYEWDVNDYFGLHGAANISYKTRFTMQICMHDGAENPTEEDLAKLNSAYKQILDNPI